MIRAYLSVLFLVDSVDVAVAGVHAFG
jgi:hypothetical protein